MDIPFAHIDSSDCLLPQRHFNIYVHQRRHLRQQKAPGNGFTLVEILVAAALLAFVVGGVASTLMLGNNALRATTRRSQLDATVDTNLAAIKDVAYRMTCCSGSCSINQASINAAATCTSKVPGSQNYYFPEPTTGSTSDTTEIASFKDRCNATGLGGSLVESLIASIAADNAASAVLPNGITRSFDTTAAGRNRLFVSYSDGVSTRSYSVVPVVAAWCP